MANADSQVLIEIKTAYDGGGTDDAAAGLGKVQEVAQGAAASSGELGTNLGSAAQNAQGAATAAGALAGGLAAAGQAAGEIADDGGKAAQAIRETGEAAEDAAPAAEEMAGKWEGLAGTLQGAVGALAEIAGVLDIIFGAFAKGFEEVAKFNEEVRKVHETTIDLQDSLAAALGHDPRSAFEKQTAVMSRDELAAELERKKAERKDASKNLPLTITEFEKAAVDADGLVGRIVKAMGKGGLDAFLKQNHLPLGSNLSRVLEGMVADETWGKMNPEQQKKAVEDAIKKEIARVGEMTRQIEDLERRIGRYDERDKRLSREERLAGASPEEKERLRGEFLDEDIAELEARREERAKYGKDLVAEDELRLKGLYNQRKARGGSALPSLGNGGPDLPDLGNGDAARGAAAAANDAAGAVQGFARAAADAIAARDRELDELRAAQERLARELEQAKSQLRNGRN